MGLTIRNTPTLPALRLAHPDALPATVPPAIRAAATLCTAEAGPTLRELGIVDVSKRLLPVLSGVAFLLGHRNTLAEGKDLVLMATAVAEMVLRQFGSLRPAEVEAAFRRGAAGEWQRPGELLLPNLPNFTHWLTCYQQQCRSKALETLHQLAEAEQQKALPQPSYEHELPAAVAQLAEHVAKLGAFPAELDAGNLAYEWLKRIGAFNGFKTKAEYTAMLKKEAWRMSRQRGTNLGQRHQINSFAVAIRRGWPAGHPMEASLQNNCKKLLLREWIRYHIARKTDLLTWLTELSQQPISA